MSALPQRPSDFGFGYQEDAVLSSPAVLLTTGQLTVTATTAVAATRTRSCRLMRLRWSAMMSSGKQCSTTTSQKEERERESYFFPSQRRAVSIERWGGRHPRSPSTVAGSDHGQISKLARKKVHPFYRAIISHIPSGRATPSVCCVRPPTLKLGVLSWTTN